MIKLNNKNITYVALADSNNSLKAPKEIWYADSNNSVKLVYRKKDALIEGEDYEKYHWAKTDGNAYINTLVSDLTNVKNIYCKIKRPSDVSGISNQRIFGRENESGYSGTRLVVRPYDNHLDLYTSTTSCTLFTNNDDYININAETNTASTSRSSSVTIENINKNGTSLALFADHGTNSNFGAFYKGSIGEFTINELMQLVPCKLLKPVPKWLDANGIRRQVGECGMVDLVSGKFYGNVNSVGTFTVENYYERKEWLVGDGSAFLNTNGENALIGINSVEWELSGNGQAVLNSFGLTTGAAQFVSDLSYVDGSIGKIGIYDNNRAGYFWTTKLNVNTLRLVSGTTIKAITINDVDLSNPNYQWNGNFILQFINRAAGYKVSKVTVDGAERYIPCTLTMDLPASMDANNIPRTKGTSGMWDLVSDRFYGNVANSGTFKAVNLAEGVDYEVYDWLVANGDDLQSSDSQNVALFSFPSDINLVGKTVQLTMGAPCRDIYVYRYVGAGLYLILYVWNGNVGVNVNNQAILFSPLVSKEPMVLDFENNLVSYNEQHTQIAGDSFYIYFPTTAIEGKRKYGRIYCQGLFDFIPVKLLHSIPSKYDANGIARQAGECGMYDTVNDKFYGNVAPSGSFTVEDDN